MAKRKSSLRQPYYSRDRRQLTPPVFLPLQSPPSGPRTVETSWGTPPPVRRKGPTKPQLPVRHPAFDPEIPDEEVR